MLSADGSVQVRSDAIGAAYHPYRICSPHCLLHRRPRSHPIQRCPYTFLSLIFVSFSPYLLLIDAELIVHLSNWISYLFTIIFRAAGNLSYL
jgi:hypothetical protein